MTTTFDAWATLGDVLSQFTPLALFAVCISTATYLVFVVLLVRPRATRADGVVPDDAADFGVLLGPSYVLMTSLFGMVFGILISVLGGFGSSATAGSLTASVIAGVGLAVAVVGSLFVESGKIPLRRPVGAIAFLITFVVAGLYWSARLP